MSIRARTFAVQLLSSQNSQIRSFATSRLIRQEYLILAQDIQEPETLERRQDARPAHLTGIQSAVDSGAFLWGGVMQHDGKTIGSALLLQADTVEEIRSRLKDDPYIEGRVWDPEKIQIIPFKTSVQAFDKNIKTN